MSGRVTIWRGAWGVWLFFACLYALSIGRGFYTSDGEVMFQATAALVERHTLALHADSGLPQIVRGQGGHYYSKYDPGLSLAMVPFYVTGDWIAAVNAAHRTRVAATAVLLLPALAAAGALAGVYVLAARIGVALHLPDAHRRAVWIALVAGIASPLWWYGRVLFAEAVLTCALVWAVVLVTREKVRENGAPHPYARLAGAGIVFGAGLVTRAAFAIYLPGLVWLVWRGMSGCGKRRIYGLAALLAGITPGVAVVLAHNAIRFGDALQFGYTGEGFSTPLWKGIAGLLVSPGKGIAWHAPPLLAGAMLWRRFRRVVPVLAESLALLWGAALVFYGAWWAWDGGWSWGPRFLVPLIPLGMLPLVVLPAGRGWRIALALLVLAGIVVNVPAVLVDPVPHYVAVAKGQAADVDRVNWSVRDALPVGVWRRLLAGKTEPLGLFHLRATGLPPLWYAGPPLVLGLGLFAGAWIMRARREHAHSQRDHSERGHSERRNSPS